MERGAVGEQHLDPAVLRAEAIAGQQGHRQGRRFRPSGAFQRGASIHDGDVGRWLSGGGVGQGRGRLSESGGRDERQPRGQAGARSIARH